MTSDIRKFNNRCLATGVLVMCGIVLLTLALKSSRLSQQRQSSQSSATTWLRAAQRHVQSLRLGRLTAQPATATSYSPTATRRTNSNLPRKPPLYPGGFRLSNLDNFTFVVNNDVCGDAAIDVVMVVTSDTRTPSQRAAIRAALPQATLAELRMRRVFLLAQLAPPAAADEYDRRQAALHAENYEHADLVAGSFSDAYRNLTYKHLMGLHWATTYCPQARYIVKMDDDIALDVFQLHDRLATAPDRATAIGAVFAGTAPIRDPLNKWFVTRGEFAFDAYPTYMSGWMYAVTPDAAALLVAGAARLPFFWVDDAFVTGVVRERVAPKVQMLDMDQLWGQPDDTGKVTSPFTLQINCLYECAAEAGSSTGRCDTLVGPAWSNRLVLRLFTKHAEYCYRQRCARRRRMPAICHGDTQRQRTGLPQTGDDIGDVKR